MTLFDFAQDRVHECAREDQVVHAVLSGAWPDRCDEDLKVHVSHCDLCGEVAAVASLIRDDSERARRDVQVPVAGQVWWRAAVRARLETSHAATQPMTWLHGITAALAIGVMLAGAGRAWPSIAGGLESGKAVVIALVMSDAGSVVAGSLRQSLVIALGAVALLVIAPLAVYFALSDD